MAPATATAGWLNRDAPGGELRERVGYSLLSVRRREAGGSNRPAGWGGRSPSLGAGLRTPSVGGRRWQARRGRMHLGFDVVSSLPLEWGIALLSRGEGSSGPSTGARRAASRERPRIV
jgi:hypothetical protein